ncbi:MAG: hypothetical protein ACFFAN_08470 [Promethearchaeota archaeon]
MSLKNSGINNELNFCFKIIDCYLKNRNDNIKKEMCKNKSIIELMRRSDYKKKKELIKNTLIFVLSLLDDYDQPSDLYNSIGNDIKTATEEEHKEIISDLKKEFLY